MTMGNSPWIAMLFTALVSVGLIGYVIFRIARGFYRWAMGRPVTRREDEWELDDSDIEMDRKFLDKATDPSYRLLPGNIFHEDIHID